MPATIAPTTTSTEPGSTTTTTQRVCPPSGPQVTVTNVTLTSDPSPIGPQYSYLVTGTLRNPSSTSNVYVGMIYVRTSDSKSTSVPRPDPWVSAGDTVSWEATVFATYGAAPPLPNVEAFPTSWFWYDQSIYVDCPKAQKSVPSL